MHGRAQTKPWLSEEEFWAWIREEASREAFKKRLAIWLTKIGLFHADRLSWSIDAGCLLVDKRIQQRYSDSFEETESWASSESICGPKGSCVYVYLGQNCHPLASNPSLIQRGTDSLLTLQVASFIGPHTLI